MPVPEAAEGIGSDEAKDLRVCGQSGAQPVQGIDCVMRRFLRLRAGSVFERDGKARIAGDAEAAS